jgi:hypothetical protein
MPRSSSHRTIGTFWRRTNPGTPCGRERRTAGGHPLRSHRRPCCLGIPSFGDRNGRHAHTHRHSSYRNEFPPAIPRRVAPQQSPLPLRRIIVYTSSHEVGAIPRPSNLSPISVSHRRGSVHPLYRLRIGRMDLERAGAPIPTVAGPRRSGIRSQ